MADRNIYAYKEAAEFTQKNIDGFERHGGFCIEVAMDYYLLMNHWAELVRDFKDSEKEYDVDAYETELMARAILDFIRYTRIRQWTLFIQKRGEEFERMIAILEEKDFDLKAVQRFLEDEDLWKVTLEMGEKS